MRLVFMSFHGGFMTALVAYCWGRWPMPAEPMTWLQ